MVKILSDAKIFKIFSLYFQGFSQTEIANRLKITQASVSIYVSKFKSLAEQQGIMAAAEEYGVMDQVEVLYGLASELKKAKLTAEEAKAGLKIELLFHNYGVEQEEYGNLIQTCEKMKNEGYITAALELNQLEDSTGMSYEEIVTEFKSTSKQLTQSQKELQNTDALLKTSKLELADISKQKIQANIDLAKHMQQIGVDEHRLKSVEALALALKKAGISNQELQDYIQRQESLNKHEIDIGVFTDILDKSKVATLGDNGKELLNLLTECGGLVEAINKLQVKQQLLLNEVSNLEQQAKFKGKLEGEISKLKADKASLEAHVAELEKQEKSHTDQSQNKQNELAQLMSLIEQEQTSYQNLKEKEATIKKEISEKQTSSDDLDKKISLKQQGVSGLVEQESKYERLVKDNAELESKISQQKTRWKAFEGFVGMVQSSSMEDLEKNTKVLLDLITKLEPGKYSPQFLKNFILKDLAGAELQILKCTSCQARFIIDKAAQTGSYKCPLEVGFPHSVVIEKDATAILKEALDKVKSQVISASPKQWIKKVEPKDKGKEKG